MAIVLAYASRGWTRSPISTVLSDSDQNRLEFSRKNIRWRSEYSTLGSDWRTLIFDRSTKWTCKNELRRQFQRLRPTPTDCRKNFLATVEIFYHRIRSKNSYFWSIDRLHISICKAHKRITLDMHLQGKLELLRWRCSFAKEEKNPPWHDNPLL